jgi:hypothetical protein
VPVGVPRFVPVVLLGLTLLAGLLFPAIPAVPQGLRAAAIHVSYVGYLFFLTALWAGLLTAIVLASCFPAIVIHDAFVSRYEGRGRRPQRSEGILLVVYFGGLLLGASLLPPWAPLLVCAVAAAVSVASLALPYHSDLRWLWRYRGASAVRSIHWGHRDAGFFLLFTLLGINLVLLSCGSTILAEEPGTALRLMPVTTGLGLMLVWVAPGALIAGLVEIVLSWARDPARRCRPVVFLSGAGLASAAKSLAGYFASRGWLTRSAPALPRPTDVNVHVVDRTGPARIDGPEWPLQVTAETLQRPAILERLSHRDAVQKRRRFLSGLERLFKRAARFQFRSGSGFWLAPHLWILNGLIRDAQADEPNLEGGAIISNIIGPPYHRVLSRPVRHYAYQVFRAVQVDLIFVEDGVGFRRLSRVLRMMFEVFDVYDGRRKVEEVHFQGITGVRVLIHDYQLAEPFHSDVYPEPDFENLGRARILHVFRDRSEQEERIDSPLDNTFAPAPAGAM